MQYWLVKTEPDAYSWEQQVERGVEPWTGVRSHQAKNNLAAMKKRDRAFFYHSNIGKEIVGIVEVVKLAHPDSTAELKDGKVVWECVDVLPVKKLPRPVSLETVKAEPRLKDMALVKLSRLSVSPVSDAEWDFVCKLGGL
jgi:predicted RNA-binding protein with PUA-like domain